MYLVVAACGRVGFDPGVPVDGAPADVAIDASPPDSPACPAAYTTIPNAPNKYFVSPTPGTYAQGEAMCAADGAHLVVPEDRAEAIAVFGLLTNTYGWVGINDRATEADFRDHTGAPATYIHPVIGDAQHATWWWSPTTQPDNSGDSDCISFIRSGLDPNAHLDDAGCNDVRAVTCECEL